MAITLGDALVMIGGDTSGLMTALDQAQEATVTATTQLGTAVTKAVGGALLAGGAALAAGVANGGIPARSAWRH